MKMNSLVLIIYSVLLLVVADKLQQATAEEVTTAQTTGNDKIKLIIQSMHFWKILFYIKRDTLCQLLKIIGYTWMYR